MCGTFGTINWKPFCYYCSYAWNFAGDMATGITTLMHGCRTYLTISCFLSCGRRGDCVRCGVTRFLAHQGSLVGFRSFRSSCNLSEPFGKVVLEKRVVSAAFNGGSCLLSLMGTSYVRSVGALLCAGQKTAAFLFSWITHIVSFVVYEVHSHEGW